jgi:hypothetical protein
MSILVAGIRPRRRASRPSVREVCLMGGSSPGRNLESGDRLTCSGRAYRVVKSRARVGEEGEADATRYVHLTSEHPWDDRPSPGGRGCPKGG